MNRIVRILLLSFCLLAAKSQAQDPIFSQFFSNPLQINPAFAGVTYAPRISLSYRNQWPSWPNAYRTYAAMYEQSLEGLNSGIGIMVLTDDAGDGIYKTNNFNFTYSYQVQASRDLFLKLGFEAGVHQTRLDWDQLVFADQLDPRIGLQEGVLTGENAPDLFNRTSLDIGTGILLYHTNYYGGISLKHINRADESWFNVNESLNLGRPMRLSIHGGAEFSVNRGNNRLGASFISPNLLYIRQGEFSQLNVGAYAGYEKVFAGLWYRHAQQNVDAVIVMGGVKYQSLRIAYSFDVTISDLSLADTGGAHEVSISINLEDSRAVNKRRKSLDRTNCFRMFN